MRFAIQVQPLAFVGLLCSRATDGFQVTPITRKDASTTLWIAPQQLGSFETLEINSAETRNVLLEDLVSFNSERVEFTRAWDWQKQLLQEHVERLAKDETSQFLLTDDRITGEDRGLSKGGYDTIFMLEHEAVYTLVSTREECCREDFVHFAYQQDRI